MATGVAGAIEARRELVNQALERELPVKRPERLYEASRHLLDAGGKRLRPAIVLLAAEAVAGVDALSEDYRAFPAPEGPVDVMAAAIGIEIIQSFTLIHDDIMDDDDLRRGVTAVHREYDLATAILAGDTLYSKAFEFMLETGAPDDRSLRALGELATTCTRICEGQALDVAFESRTDVTTDDYLEMIDSKTAVLYATAASIPAMLLGDDEAVDALHGFGRDVGRAFQIQDDVLDLVGSSDRLGKDRGSDLVEGKRTLITLHAREQGVDVDSLVSADGVESVDGAEIDDAVDRLREVGSIDHARGEARRLVDRGKRHLEVLPDTESKETLRGIADYLIEREY